MIHWYLKVSIGREHYFSEQLNCSNQCPMFIFETYNFVFDFVHFFILLVRASLSGFWRWLLKCSEEKFVSASWSLIMLILTEYSIFHLSCIGQIYPGLSSFFGIKPHSFRSIGLENTNINTNLNTITLIKSATIYWSIILCEGDFLVTFRLNNTPNYKSHYFFRGWANWY